MTKDFDKICEKLLEQWQKFHNFRFFDNPKDFDKNLFFIQLRDQFWNKKSCFEYITLFDKLRLFAEQKNKKSLEARIKKKLIVLGLIKKICGLGKISTKLKIL